MSAANPHVGMRPDWFGAREQALLAELEDRVLPAKGFGSGEQRGVLPIVSHCFAMLWFLGKTGSLDRDEGPHDYSLENLDHVGHNAAKAAHKTREVIARIATEGYDNEMAEDERSGERNDPNWGPPQAHVVEGAVTVRLPGRSGDTVTFNFSVDDSGHLRAEGNGPFAELDLLTRLDLRAACAVWEALTERISSVVGE
ncbi:hypothetical protein ACFV8E_41090 [Streptomyces sp. NPDC059849]|uniref:hypothetical protein n=1 Tax=Streptomyces sp. NPDC059849 TaxID=3346969 RepID=UPI0036493194